MCNIYSLEERVLFVKSYYSTQKNLKEFLCLYGEQLNAPRRKWPSKSVIIGEFKSHRIFNEEPASKENHRIGGTQQARAYRFDFCQEKC